MSALHILQAARERISDPAQWTQEALARDRSGTPVSVSAKNAVCWCAIGAANAEYDATPAREDVWFSAAVDALDDAAERLGVEEYGGSRPIAHLNDTRDHATILAAFDDAIAALAARGSR